MTTYLVRLNGQNFLIDRDGGPRKMRFYSTRLVEAEDPKQAEILALDFIRNDTRLQDTVLTDVSDPPMIYHDPAAAAVTLRECGSAHCDHAALSHVQSECH